MPKPYGDMFLAEIGHAWRLDGDVVTGEIEAIPELCLPGTARIRPSVLAATADVVAGVLANKTIGPRIPLTVDLTFRPLGEIAGRIRMAARNLKVGRTTVVSETIFAGGGETPVAVSHTTFIASPRPDDVMAEVHWERSFVAPVLDSPLPERMGCVEISPGVVELARTPYVLQPAGTIQGGAVAMVAEMAAASLTGSAVDALEIRYLSAVRVGPARAVATRLGGTTVRVEVRDAGNHDRLATLVLAQSG